tara:strand:+ start:1028 stop:2845 length:1818 start_codon:yes stop_codon:yes gene_type:complete
MTTANMKRRVIKYEIPALLDSNVIYEVPDDLENAVLAFKNRGGDEIFFDLGCMCYKHFDTKNTGSDSVVPVDTRTLDKTRRPLLRAIVTSIRTSAGQETSSKITNLNGYRLFIKFINETAKPDFNFKSTSDFKEIYTEYTKQLYTRMKSADGTPNKISNNSACVLQKRARRVIQLAVGSDFRAITYWATPIRFNDREKYVETLTDNPLTEEDMLETYAALCDFIHQAWSVLIKRDKKNVVLNDTVVFDIADYHKDHILNPFFTKVATSAILSFIGASGANLTPLLEAKMSDEQSFEQAEIKGLRISGVKYRGGVAEKEYTIVNGYLPIWKKWADIRELMLSLRDGDPDSPFILVGNDGRLKKFYGSAADRDGHAAKMFMEHYGVEWLTARPLRKLYASLAREATGNDIIEVAKLLGNEVSTAVKSYENINLAEHAEVIQFAMNSIHESASKRVRDSDFIDVTIIEGDRDLNKTTMIGDCQSEGSLQPERAEGFNDFAPEPDCRIKETCIFCKMYAAHADEVDIRKLLSFKLLITEVGATMPTEEWAVKWAPYEDRIEEIFTQMRKVRPETEAMIIEIEDQVSCGMLDEYWADVLSDMYEFGRLTA